MENPAFLTASFANGALQDLVADLQPQGTYLESENGTISGEGAKGSWSPAEGTTEVLGSAQGIPSDAIQCGAIETTGNARLLFLRRVLGNQDEIGLFDGTTYTSLYKSGLDPSGYALGLHPDTPVEGFYLEESPVLQRAYFHVPGLSEPCVIDLQNPAWRTAHAFALQPDCRFPLVRFRRRLETTPVPGPDQAEINPVTDRPTYFPVPAALVTGVYKLLVRYRVPGHVSPCSLPSDPVYLTDRAFDGVAVLNPFRRSMSVSSSVAREGIEWELTGLDTRWPEVELIYLYAADATGYREARLFSRVAVPINGNLSVRLLSNTGTPLDPVTLLRRDTTIRSCQTLTPVKGYLFLGDYRTSGPPEIDTRTFSVATRTITLEEDSTPITANLFTKSASVVNNPLAIEPASRPLVPARVNEDYNLQSYQPESGPPVTRPISLVNDFKGWRSQAVWGSLRGYFGGENVGFGLLGFDTKGHVMPVVALGDYVIPRRGSAEAPMSQPTTGGKYAAVSVGCRLSGIRIKKSSLVSNGKLLMSGLSIVRRPSSPGKRGRPLHQGILLPVVQADGATDDWRKPPNIFVNPSVTNHYSAGYATVGPPGGHNAPAFPAGKELIQSTSTPGPMTTLTMPGYATYHSPDALIAGGLQGASADRMQVVTVARCGAGEEANQLASGVTEAQYFHIHRLYNTHHAGLSLPANRPQVGSESRVTLAKPFLNQREVPLEKFDPDRMDRKAYPNVDIVYPVGGGVMRYAHIQKGASLVRVPDFESVDASGHAGPRAVYVVNYYRADTEANESDLDSDEWVPTGHYLPLTLELIDSLPDSTDPDGTEWVVLNGVDVFGGDCVTTMADMATLVPGWDGTKKDYGEGLIVPIESSYNLDLRVGRRLAESGLYPEWASRNQVSLSHLTGGISDHQWEDWDLNDVLKNTENIAVFNSLPPDTPLSSRQSASLAFSLDKLPGQREDSFRRFLPLNVRVLEGEHGPITAAFPCFDNLYFNQAHALGVLPVKEQSLVPTTSGSQLAGSGENVGAPRYISRYYGCQHHRAACATDRAYFFLDMSRRTWMRHSQNGLQSLSDERGFAKSIRAGCSAYAGGAAAMGYEVSKGRVWLSLNDKMYSYSEQNDRFVGHIGMAPKWMVMASGVLLAPSPVPDHRLWELNRGPRGVFFGVAQGVRLRFLTVAPVTSDFDNAVLVGNHAALKTLGASAWLTYWTDVTETPTLLRPWTESDWSELSGGKWHFPLVSAADALRPDSVPRLSGRILYCEFAAGPNPAGLPDFQLTAHVVATQPSYSP